MLLVKKIRIGPVMGPRSVVLARGRRPWANTADRGPVTGPMRNYLINDNFTDFLNCRLKHVRHVCMGRKRSRYDVFVIGRVVLAELRQYWPSCSVSAEFVTHLIRTAFALYILYY